MNSLVEITAEEVSDELDQVIRQGFLQHSIEATGLSGNIQSLAFVARQEGKIVGGLVAKTFWGALHIRHLWVEGGLRGQGLGRKLMEKAFEKGRELGCPFAYVETMSFQAVGFYRSLGFQEDFVRYGYEGDTSFHYLTKSL